MRTSAVPGPTTSVGSVSVLFAGSGSAVVDDTVTVLLSVVPAAVPAARRTRRSKVAEAPAASVATAHETVPVVPVAGAVQVQPAAGVRLSNTVPAGTTSLNCTFAAAPGPRFSTAIV